MRGFFVLRYVLALIAVGPVYLLLRRLYGRPAGVVGVLVVLSSPVMVTAWGTDYPDSAVVSYAAGALACLAMPCSPRWRRAWLAAAGVLLTAAVWSHGVAVPLVGATLVGYLAVRLVRDRAGLPGDLVLLAGVAAAVTGLLIAASAVLIGHANFIATTWQAYRFLSQPSQKAQWHSANWRWAPYVAYLLVPPAVLAAFAVAVARRGRAVATPVLLVGVMVATQLVVYVLLQFFGTVQTLEQHYFSSTLWAGVCLAFAITIAELARPLSDRPIARWLPAAVLLAVPLGYEADPHVPAFGWAAVRGHPGRGRDRRGSRGARLRPGSGSPLAAAAATRAGARRVRRRRPGAHRRAHPGPPAAARYHPGSDPPPAYASALGGSGTIYIDSYRIATALPVFVGPAAYRGEQILIWWLTPGRPRIPHRRRRDVPRRVQHPAQLTRRTSPRPTARSSEQAAGRAAAGRQLGGVIPHGAAPSVRLPADPDARRGAARRPLGPARLAHPAGCLLPSAGPRRLGSAQPPTLTTIMKGPGETRSQRALARRESSRRRPGGR